MTIQKDPMFEYLVKLNPFKRDVYFLECLLYRIVLKYIRREEYNELLVSSNELYNNLIERYPNELYHYYENNISYIKTLIDSGFVVEDFLQQVKNKKGRI